MGALEFRLASTDALGGAEFGCCERLPVCVRLGGGMNFWFASATRAAGRLDVSIDGRADVSIERRTGGSGGTFILAMRGSNLSRRGGNPGLFSGESSSGPSF